MSKQIILYLNIINSHFRSNFSGSSVGHRLRVCARRNPVRVGSTAILQEQPAPVDQGVRLVSGHMSLSQTPSRERIHHHGTVRQQLQEAWKQTFSGQDEFRPDFQPQVRSKTSETEKRTTEEVQEVFLAFDGNHK